MDTMADGQRVAPAGGLVRYIPILGWARSYDRAKWLRADLMSGIMVAAFSVPESMAYASLAGLSPEHGLYASMAALLIYTFFGTSRQMSVGITSALAIMVAGTLGGMALSGPDQYLAAAQLTAIIAGVFAVAAGLLRLGFIVNFISESVLKGFSAGAALFIASSQLAKLFGIEGVEGNFFDRVWNVLKNLDATNGWTLGLGVVSLAGLLLLEEKAPRLPGSLIVVLLAIAAMQLSNLEERGVDVAGDIPGGLPSLGIGDLPSGVYSELLALGFGCFLLSYVEGIGVARTFAAKYKQRIDPNQELYANGAINIASGIVKGLPVGGSMSRSAVSDASGAKTPLAGGFAALLLVVVLLFLTGLFSELPEATLAAIVLVAVRGLIDIPALRKLFHLSRTEFLAAVLSAAGVLVFGMLEGIMIGAGFTLLALVYRASKPRVEPLGRIPGTGIFASVLRHPEIERVPGVIVCRVDGDIFYANAEAIKDEILALLQEPESPVERLIVDLSNVPAIDLAGIDMVEELHDDLASRQVSLELAGATGEVRDAVRRAGITEKVGPLEPGMTIESVVGDTRKGK